MNASAEPLTANPVRNEKSVFAERLKVALISFDFGEYCIRNANALANANCEVKLIMPSNVADTHARLLDSKVSTHWFHRPRFRHPLRNIRVISIILWELKSYTPDVVHFQGGHLWFNFVLNTLRKRYPLVVTIHNVRHHLGDRSSGKIPQWVMDLGYRQADAVVVHGDNLRSQVANVFPKLASHTTTVPHIVMGGEDDGDNTNGMRQQKNHILFFGRIWQYKGLEYLIKAVPKIAEAVPDVKVIIAGKGDDFSNYQSWIDQQDASRFEVHNEYISNERREELFARSEVVVLPYVAATQSGVIPIAYTYKKPVIATTVGCLPEVVFDGQTGFLVPPRDSDALAHAAIRILQNPDLQKKMGEAGYTRQNLECGPVEVARQHRKVYQYAIARRAKSSANVPPTMEAKS